MFGYKSDSSDEDFVTQPPENAPADDDLLEYDDEDSVDAQLKHVVQRGKLCSTPNAPKAVKSNTGANLKSPALTHAEIQNLNANLSGNKDMLW